MKNLLRFFSSRVVLVGTPLLIQVFFMIVVILKFSSYFVYVYTILTLLSGAALLKILTGKSNPAYKIAWIIPIMLFPIFGGLFYLLFGGNNSSKRMKRKMHDIEERMTRLLGQNEAVIEEIQSLDRSAANQSRYIEKYSFCPVYNNTTSEYLSPGECEALLCEHQHSALPQHKEQ